MGSCCIAQGAQLDALWRDSGVGWREWEGGLRGRGIHIYILKADSRCCRQKPTQSNYPTVKNKKFLKRANVLLKDPGDLTPSSDSVSYSLPISCGSPGGFDLDILCPQGLPWGFSLKSFLLLLFFEAPTTAWKSKEILHFYFLICLRSAFSW